MKKQYALLLIIAFVPVVLLAQSSICESGRYFQLLFSEINIDENVPYGQAKTIAGVDQVLTMDVFEPAGDTLSKRPLIVVAHGGAFITGSREDTKSYCIEYTKRGYVVANISYRLLDGIVTDSTGMFEEVIMAINDMRAAVRFFREDAAMQNKYKVDPDLIFAAGVSAGGIMASHLGFLDANDELPDFIKTTMEKHGGFEGNSSENTQYASNVQGVLNFSGALIRDYWIDSDDAPVYSAHDDLDPTVPCGYGDSGILPFPAFVYGSCAMKEIADEQGVKNQLHLISNSAAHVSYFQNAVSSVIVLGESLAFLRAIICGEISTNIAQEQAKLLSLSVYPNPVSNELHIESDLPIKSLVISNIMGQVCYVSAEPNEKSIALSHFNKGIYFLRIETSKGFVTKKIIKN